MADREPEIPVIERDVSHADVNGRNAEADLEEEGLVCSRGRYRRAKTALLAFALFAAAILLATAFSPLIVAVSAEAGDDFISMLLFFLQKALPRCLGCRPRY